MCNNDQYFMIYEEIEKFNSQKVIENYNRICYRLYIKNKVSEYVKRNNEIQKRIKRILKLF